MEVGLGLALLTARRRRPVAGWVTAAFLVAVFPANVHQAMAGIDVPGLDSDAARWGRLPLQVVLVAAALWSTGAVGRAASAPPTDGEEGHIVADRVVGE
jgi:uncharacterized membrane protein